MPSYNNALGSKKFTYFPLDKEGQEQRQVMQGESETFSHMLDKLLKAVGREALKEKTLSLQELEQTLQGLMSSLSKQQEGEPTTTRTTTAGVRIGSRFTR